MQFAELLQKLLAIKKHCDEHSHDISNLEVIISTPGRGIKLHEIFDIVAIDEDPAALVLVGDPKAFKD